MPTTERPTSQPSRNDDPLTPPRGVASISTTAMIGIGLRATPRASGRTVPIALPMVGSLLEDPYRDGAVGQVMARQSVGCRRWWRLTPRG